MGMVLATGAPLPDSFVGLAPALADRVTEVVQQADDLAIEVPTLPCKPRHGIDDLAVDVELELTLGLVPDPARPRRCGSLRSGTRASPKTSYSTWSSGQVSRVACSIQFTKAVASSS